MLRVIEHWIEVAYFRHAACKSHLQRMDEWIRRKLRYQHLPAVGDGAGDDSRRRGQGEGVAGDDAGEIGDVAVSVRIFAFHHSGDFTLENLRQSSIFRTLNRSAALFGFSVCMTCV